MAGASGIMTGNYLTRKGRSLKDDLELVRDMGLETKETQTSGL
jgi:biotin synthase